MSARVDSTMRTERHPIEAEYAAEIDQHHTE